MSSGICKRVATRVATSAAMLCALVITPVSLAILAGAKPASAAPAVSCDTPITHSVTLTANLNCTGTSGLEIGAGGITINLDGYTVSGGGGGYGGHGLFFDSSYPNVAVIDGTIKGFSYDVYIEGATNLTLASLKLLTDGYGSYYGAYLDNVDVGHITGLTIGGETSSEYPNAGFQLYESTGVRVASSTVTDAEKIGFYDKYGTGDSFVGDTASSFYSAYGNHANGFEDHESSNTYTADHANGDYYGFYFNCLDDGFVNVTSSTADNNAYDGFLPEACYLGSSGSTFTDDTADGNGDGLYSYYNDYVSVTGSTFDDNRYYGVFSYYDYGGLFGGDTASNNGYGMVLDYPAYYTVSNNTTNYNSYTGIYLEHNSSVYNVTSASGNTAYYNDDYGLYANSAAPSAGNVAHYNVPSDCYNVVCNSGGL